MEKRQEIELLMKQTELVIDGLHKLAETSELDLLLKHIPTPGWTTLAEYQLAKGILQGIQTQIEALNVLQQSLINGDREIMAAV